MADFLNDFTEDDLLTELEFEEMLDGSVLFGAADQEAATPQLREWDSNILADFSLDEMQKLASELLSYYEEDEQARSKWKTIYEKGLQSLNPDDTPSPSDKSSPRRIDSKLTKVVHPMIAEAATQFQARAIGEMFPPAGPVGATIVGEPTEETQEQARRVSTYMNYQITEEMEEYFPDLDQMLFHLPLVGHTFKKAWLDVNLGRITSRYIHADDLVVDASAVDLPTAQRFSHKLRLYKYEFDNYVQNGFYEDLPEDFESPSNQEPTIPEKVDGIEITSQKDGKRLLIEMYVYLDLLSEENDPDKPFVFTIDYESKKPVALRKNWDEDDPKYKKNIWFVSYKFLPGLGFYGYGLYHIIGSLGQAATGALRALLDSAAFSNLQGGFKLKGRVQGGETDISPGEFADISSAVDDIKKAIMPLPFKEPSATLMQLLTYVVETGKRFANTIETNISDANQNTPVGTTVALLEEQSRVFSAVHKRLHNAQRQEFKLIARLNGIYLPEQYPYKVKTTEQVIMRLDFDDRIDIIPVSDPSTFSSTQRISQAQAMLQMAQMYPQFHNQYKALERMYEAIRIPNFDEVLRDPAQTERMDAVAENTFIMMGRPIKAYEDQDHLSHLTVLDDWFNRLPGPMQAIHGQTYLAHRNEHMALYYRTMIQAQMGQAMPMLPDFEDEVPPTDPQTDALISQAAAAIIVQSPQPQIGPDPPNPKKPPGQEDGGEGSAQNDAANAQATLMKAQASIQAQQMKAQADMQIKAANAKLDLKIEMIREQGRQRENAMRAAQEEEQGNKTLFLKDVRDQRKLDAELEKMWAKLNADIDIEVERAQAQIAIQQTQAAIQQDIQLSTAASKEQIAEEAAAREERRKDNASSDDTDD